jgi:hypothetical protein
MEPPCCSPVLPDAVAVPPPLLPVAVMRLPEQLARVAVLRNRGDADADLPSGGLTHNDSRGGEERGKRRSAGAPPGVLLGQFPCWALKNYRGFR